MRAKKIWCPNTRSAFQILSESKHENYKHIVIHTGTNDLRAMKGRVAPVMREVAIRATQRFPEARVTLSTLLPRTDVPIHVIHGNNVNSPEAAHSSLMFISPITKTYSLIICMTTYISISKE